MELVPVRPNPVPMTLSGMIGLHVSAANRDDRSFTPAEHRTTYSREGPPLRQKPTYVRYRVNGRVAPVCGR